MLVADFTIGISYLFISVTLFWLIKRLRLPFSPVIMCFCVFIAACGTTHFFEIWTLWHPDYWWAAILKILTAIASVASGIYLFQLRHNLIKVAQSSKLAKQRSLELESLTRELERKVEERATELQHTSDILTAVVSTTSDIIYVKNRNSGMVYCNPTALKMIGASEHEIYGKTDIDFLKAGGEAVLENDARVMTSGKSEETEEQITWKDGTTHISI